MLTSVQHVTLPNTFRYTFFFVLHYANYTIRQPFAIDIYTIICNNNINRANFESGKLTGIINCAGQTGVTEDSDNENYRSFYHLKHNVIQPVARKASSLFGSPKYIRTRVSSIKNQYTVQEPLRNSYLEILSLSASTYMCEPYIFH